MKTYFKTTFHIGTKKFKVFRNKFNRLFMAFKEKILIYHMLREIKEV